MKKIFVIIIALLILPVFAFAYKSPGQPTGYVNDYAGVLNDQTKQNLEKELSDFEKNTSHEISIVTIKSLEDDTVENYAHELMREWGIGKKGLNNGILFLVSIGDKKARVEVGPGLQGVLPDTKASQIYDTKVKPFFKNNDYNRGITEAVKYLKEAVVDEKVASSEKASTANTSSLIGLALAAIMGLILSVFIAKKNKKQWYLGGMVGSVFAALAAMIGGSAMFFIIGILLCFLVSFLAIQDFSKFSSTDGGGSIFMGGDSSNSSSSDSGDSGFSGFGGGDSDGGGASGDW